MNVYNELFYSEIPISRTKIHFASVGFTVINFTPICHIELPTFQSTFGFPLIGLGGSRNQDYTVLTLLS